MKCPDGHDNPGDANFCEKCGKKILAPPSPTASPPSASASPDPAAEATPPRAAEPPAEAATPVAKPAGPIDQPAAAEVQPPAASPADPAGPKSKKQLIIGIVVGAVVIIVVLGIIGAIIGEEESAPVESIATLEALSVGDCLDAAGAPWDCSSEEAAWEVFFVTAYEASSDDYPGETVLQSFAEAECGTEPDVLALYPLFDGWNQGDREIVCLFQL